MAVVLEVEAVDGGPRRALKLMLPTAQQEEVVLRFRREFRALSRLDHPGVLRVFEAGVQDDRPWFVMELLEGRDLREVVEDWRELPPAERYERSRSVLVQLARALAYIHGRGLVHRDVTPANIMMLPDGTAKLMDFGVVKEPGGDLTSVGEVVGTVAYIAPEQISGGAVDFRADLYSLGAVYYLMLTGRRPFNARTLAGYMDKHLHRPVRPPRELVPTIPAGADDVCVRLLQKDPSERLSSANHLLHVLHASESSSAAPGRSGWSPRLVGRAAEISTIRSHLARLATVDDSVPTGGFLVLTGDAGMGLGRLADEVALYAERHGLAFSRGRNRDPGQEPYEAFRELYRDLKKVRGEGESPVLDAIFGESSAAGQRIERYAVMDAMGALAAGGPPRVLLLEDLNRADRGSLELLEYLVRNLIGEGRGPVLVVATRSVPVVDADDPLRSLFEGATTGVEATEVVLGPIAASAVEELLLGIIADSANARELARRLHVEGQGNPFFVVEMIRGLMEQGLIEFDRRSARGQLVLKGDAVADLVLPVPRTLRDIIRKRLAPMSEEARRVALALGMARADLDLDLLISVVERDEETVHEALDELIASRLVRAERRDERDLYELDRNRVADVLLAETPKKEVVALHRRIADSLEIAFRGRVELVVDVLAHHYEMAGWPAKAVPYLMAAAERLTQRAFVSEGLALLDRARSLEGAAAQYLPLEDAERRRASLQLARASALVHLGEWTQGWGEAASAHLLAQHLDDPRLLVRTNVELATQARRQLALDAASAHLSEALALCDQLGDEQLRIVPEYEAGAVAWIQGDLEAARTHFLRAQHGAAASADDRSTVLGANGLGLIALCLGQGAEARRCFGRAVEIAERFGLMDRLSTARANLIEVYHLTGNLRKGIELADRAVAHAREVRHMHGIGTGLRYRVLMLTDLGRGLEAVHNAEEALRIHESLENDDDVLSVLVVLIRALLAHGRTERLPEMLDRAMSITDESDSEGFLPLLLAWRARLLIDDGKADAARTVLERIHAARGREWPHQQVRLSLNLARIHERLGELNVALEHAEAALSTADASGFRFYAMRARQLLARLSTEEDVAKRHGRVGDALARSLAANLPREESVRFLERQGVRSRARTLR